MRRPRIGLGAAMVLVVAVAVNCGAIRYAFVKNDPAVSPPVIGSLLPANVLVLGTFRLATSRGSRRPFLLGFVSHGVVALTALLLLAWFSSSCRREIFRRALDPILDVLRSSLSDSALQSPWVAGPIVIVIITVLVGLPVLMYAALGGLLCTFVARVAVPDRTAEGSG